MNRHNTFLTHLVAALALSHPLVAAPPAAANAAFVEYAHSIETRLGAQHSTERNFLAPTGCRQTQSPVVPCIERVAFTPLPTALLHHWRATQFVPGTKAADLDRLLRDSGAYPNLFAPQVERARATLSSPDHLHLALRLRQRHVLTVVLDADYDVAFAQFDAQHRYSISRSTHISEIDSPGTSAEHALPVDRDHGFLWRQNTYWSYEERDGGLLIQVESLSLTRAVPNGLGWAVNPYIQSIPRDSLEFTLHCISAALLHTKAAASA